MHESHPACSSSRVGNAHPTMLMQRSIQTLLPVGSTAALALGCQRFS